MRKFIITAIAVAAVAFTAHATEQGKDARGFIMQNVYHLGPAFNNVYTTTQSDLHGIISSAATPTKAVMVVCTTACHLAQSTSPATATTANFILPANTPLILKVVKGDSIRAVQFSSGGTLSVVILK
tara:strand:+ start:1858 stop:2238 length:381 start_codon:yes stop_codon:yes gene_type:complete